MTVDISRLSYSWPSATHFLFENINLEFPTGQTTCLLGPNGSGKTTLMELVLGWRHPSSGSVRLNGLPVGEIPSQKRGQSMALVPQDERLPFDYSVLEYVLLGRAPYLKPLAAPGRKDRDLAMAILEKVGIPELTARSVRKLSGGELRLVLIARALLQEPRILLLDEPANHLDPANRERVIEILSSLHDSGITLLISSHEPDLVIRLADNIVLLKSGEPPVSGGTADMLTSENLARLYGVPVTIADVNRRKVILWGDS